MRGPSPRIEIIEQTINLAAQSLERPPNLSDGRFRFLGFGLDRQFGCSFCHLKSPPISGDRADIALQDGANWFGSSREAVLLFREFFF